MTNRTRDNRGPYMYLHYFDKAHSQNFFGREREIRILLSDVIVNRLVVLFAKTGTGKTSLINAGVRPRLEPDYKTFYVRVEGDPIKATREVLLNDGCLMSREGAPLRQQLRFAMRKRKRPIVLFYDQFEEFFEQITTLSERQRFIGEIAETYQDREADARIVFSMREEYFHEMDDFRDRVPSIFHKSSNLRLRPLDADQARLAIVEPAKLFGVVIEDELTEQLIRDLHTDAGILPAHLQIVCDTLWKKWRERAPDATSITLQDYLGLGRGEGNPADRIYQRRVEEDLNGSLDDGQLELFRGLMPELRTASQTKRPKEFTDLVERLSVNPDTLNELVEVLTGIGLLRVFHRYEASYVEWTSDYLASRTDELVEQTRKLFLLRLVVHGLDERQRQIARPPEPGIPQLPPLELSELQALSQEAALISDQIDVQKAEFLFFTALYHGEAMELWADVARRMGVDIWSVLERSISDKTTPLEAATNALRFLARSDAEQARRLLRLALQQDSLASLSVEVIANSGNEDTTQLLATALDKPELAEHTVTALSQQSSGAALELLAEAARRPGSVSLTATTALYKISTGRPSGATSRATQLLEELLTERAEPLLIQALDLGLETAFWVGQAAARGVDVWTILEQSVQDRAAPLRRARNAVDLLGTLAAGPADDPTVDRSLKLLARALTDDRLAERAVEVVSGLASSEAVRLLERALKRDSTTLHAAKSLYDIARSRAGKASSDADDVIQGVFKTTARPLFLRALRQGETPRFWFDRALDYGVDAWALIVQQIEQSDSDPATAEHTVRLLGELANDPTTQRQALTLLRLATQQEPVAALGVSTIGTLRTDEAVDLLGSLLNEARLSARARRALENLADDWGAPPELQQRANGLLERPTDLAPAPDVTRQRQTRSKPQGQRLTASEPFGEHDWERLLRGIADGNCTPVVGPGASYPSMPLPSQIAQQWADEYEYPLEDSNDLAAVAQFLTVTTDPYYPRDLIRQIYDAASAPNRPPRDDDVQGVLARFPIRVYVSTVFDDLLIRALRDHDKMPVVALAKWNEDIKKETPRAGSTDGPTQAEPLVLHFYGHPATPESLVLTQDEHLQFLQSLAEPHRMFPPYFERAFAKSALLFLGQSPTTLSGRTVLAAHRAMAGRAFLRSSFAVLLPPPEFTNASRLQRYLDAYLSQQGIRVYWGDIKSFSAELQARWQSYA